jgi:hypothetical protein
MALNGSHGGRQRHAGIVMALKIETISNDPLKQVVIVRIVDVLDDHPRVEAVMKMPTSDTQTQAQIHAAIKKLAGSILEEASRICH